MFGVGEIAIEHFGGLQMSYLYIFLTIAFTVYGQIVLKWQVALTGGLPLDGTEKMFYLSKLFLNIFLYDIL